MNWRKRWVKVVDTCFFSPQDGKPVHLWKDEGTGEYRLAHKISFFHVSTICGEPERWIELNRRRLSALASLPPNSRPY